MELLPTSHVKNFTVHLLKKNKIISANYGRDICKIRNVAIIMPHPVDGFWAWHSVSKLSLPNGGGRECRFSASPDSHPHPKIIVTHA